MPANGKTTRATDSPTRINENAPVVGAGEIDVGAPPEAVWEVLTAFEAWPSWNPDIKSMTVQGPIAAGSGFRWKAGPGTIESTIERVEQPRLIAWTGTTLGIKAIHFWHLEPRKASTLVRTEESYEGLVSRLLRRPLQKTLDRALADGLRYLKAEVERRTATKLVLRDVEDRDLGVLFEHWTDREAIRMAAFTPPDPDDRAAFERRWARLRSDGSTTNRVIEIGGRVVGHIASFDLEGRREITYWIGREDWGRGIATRALREFLHVETSRPLHAGAASDNAASIRVLTKCGFRIVGEGREVAHGRGEETGGVMLRLDA